MADVTALLRRTLQQLRADRTRIDRQITALEGRAHDAGRSCGLARPRRREEGEQDGCAPAADDECHAEEGDQPAHEGLLGAAPHDCCYVASKSSFDAAM